MIDPVNPQDKVVVVAVMAKKKIRWYISCDVRTFANHFRNLIPLYQPELAKKKSFIPLSNFKYFQPSVWLTLIFPEYLSVHLSKISPTPPLSNSWLRDCHYVTV